MISEITTLLTGVHTAQKMAEGALKLTKDMEVRSAVSEILQKLIDVQLLATTMGEKYDELAKVKRELEAKIVSQEEWKATASRYELHALAPGVFVYASKPQPGSTEPPHHACAHCMHQLKLSIIQRPKAGTEVLVCPACKFEINTVPPTFGFTVIPRTPGTLL